MYVHKSEKNHPRRFHACTLWEYAMDLLYYITLLPLRNESLNCFSQNEKRHICVIPHTSQGAFADTGSISHTGNGRKGYFTKLKNNLNIK